MFSEFSIDGEYNIIGKNILIGHTFNGERGVFNTLSKLKPREKSLVNYTGGKGNRLPFKNRPETIYTPNLIVAGFTDNSVIYAFPYEYEFFEVDHVNHKIKKEFAIHRKLEPVTDKEKNRLMNLYRKDFENDPRTNPKAMDRIMKNVEKSIHDFKPPFKKINTDIETGNVYVEIPDYVNLDDDTMSPYFMKTEGIEVFDKNGNYIGKMPNLGGFMYAFHGNNAYVAEHVVDDAGDETINIKKYKIGI